MSTYLALVATAAADKPRASLSQPANLAITTLARAGVWLVGPNHVEGRLTSAFSGSR